MTGCVVPLFRDERWKSGHLWPRSLRSYDEPGFSPKLSHLSKTAKDAAPHIAVIPKEDWGTRPFSFSPAHEALRRC